MFNIRLTPISIIGLCCVVPSGAWAEAIKTPSALEQARPSRPALPRWAENYEFLKDEAKRTDPYDALRYIPLGGSAWLQTGAELRYRADAVDQPFFGLRGIKDDSYLQQRLQFHGDLHLLDDQLRVFAQLQDNRTWGKDLFSPFDESRTELQQVFLDWKLKSGSGYQATTRLGRQELAYGSLMLISDRDAPNVRNNLDGIRVMLKTPSGISVDAFSLRPVEYGVESFDDQASDNVRFHGVYGTVPVSEAVNFDLYGLDLETKDRSLAGATGDEKRYTAGARFFGKHNGFDWTWEGAGQFGHLGDARIMAWFVSGATGYTFDHPWKPRIGLRSDIASGDADRGDNKVGTFDPLYSKNGYYGEASLTTLSNLIVFGPSLAFSPTPKFRIEPAVYGAWRESENDGVYFTGVSLVPNTQNVSGKAVGTIYKATGRWLAGRNVTVDMDWEYFDVAKAIKEVGGKSVHFVSLRTTFRY